MARHRSGDPSGTDPLGVDPAGTDPLAWIDACPGGRLLALLAEHGQDVTALAPPAAPRPGTQRRPAAPPGRVPVPLRDRWLAIDTTGSDGTAQLVAAEPGRLGPPVGPAIDLGLWRRDLPGWRLIRTDVSADGCRWLFLLRAPDREVYRAAVYQIGGGVGELLDQTPPCAPDCLLTADGSAVVYVAADNRGWPTTLRVRDLRTGLDRAVLTARDQPGGRVRLRRASHPAYVLVADGVRPAPLVSALEPAAPGRAPVILPGATRLARCDVGLWHGAAVLCALSAEPSGDTHLTTIIRTPAGDRPHTRRLGSIGTPEEIRATGPWLLVRTSGADGERVLRYAPPAVAGDGDGVPGRAASAAAGDRVLVRGAGRLDLGPNCLAESVGWVVLERRAGQPPLVHAWDRAGARIAVHHEAQAAAPRLARRELLVPAGGAAIPVSLAWSEGAGTGAGFAGPLVLFVYGAYGVRLSLDGLDDIRALTDAGLAVGVVGVRGGGGPEGWHDAGRGRHRQVPVADLHAAVAHLRSGREPGITVTSLGLVGASAGGFLVGAALNQFGGSVDAAVMTNGFLDPMPALLDEACPLAAADRAEWGDVRRNPQAYRALAALSPYGNLTARLTTSVLLLVSDRDRQVSPAQSLKWYLRARALDSPAQLWYFPGSGHATMRGGPAATAAVHAWLVEHLR